MKSCHLDFPEENLFTPKVPCRKKKNVEKKINQNSIATTTKKTPDKSIQRLYYRFL